MQLPNITLFLNGLAQSLGLPLWAILLISIFFLIYVYLYGILIPITAIRTRKELANLRQALKISEESAKLDYAKKGPKYKWRT